MRSTEHCLAYSSSLREHLAISRDVLDGHSWGRGMCEGATSILWGEARYNHCILNVKLLTHSKFLINGDDGDDDDSDIL